MGILATLGLWTAVSVVVTLFVATALHRLAPRDEAADANATPSRRTETQPVLIVEPARATIAQ